MSLLTMASRRRGRGSAPASPANAIAASLTRYDGGSGNALFQGTIPLPPGEVTSASDLDTYRVLVNGSEPAGGIYIDLLQGTRSDGSYRAAFVEFEASCGSAETVPCEVRTGESRLVADRGSLNDATLRTSKAWLASPTLFFVTDADYRVSCRTAPLPLVTMSTVQSNCPAAWYDALTTEFDSRFTASVTSSTEYEVEYAMACRAEMTGDPADAHRAFSQFTARFYDVYTPGDGVYSPNLNLGASAGSGFALNPEWKFAGGILLMAYYHTGHEQFRANLELLTAYGRDQRVDTVYGIRNNLRKFMGSWLAGTYITPNRTIASPGGGWSHDPTAMTDAAEVTAFLDKLETNANTLTVANGVPAWAEGYALYGLHADAWTADPAENPTFQIGVAPWSLMFAYLNYNADSRIPAALDDMRSFLDGQLEPYTVSGLNTYRHSYLPIDPADADTDAGGVGDSVVLVFLSTMFTPIYAFAYARDNADTTARDMADALVDVRIWDKDNSGAVGGGGTVPSHKTVGEWVQMIPHSAAWRAGVPWNGWEVA